jgi:PAS domain S-box-containing protein
VVSVFRWVGMAYAGSAALATLLLVAYGLAGVGVWLVMLPLLAMLLVTLHFYFRQQESAEALRERTAEAELREAEASRRHLRELHASEARFHGAFTHAAIGMALLGYDGRILQANGALGALLGRDAGALAGCNLAEFVDAEHGEVLRARLAEAAAGRFDRRAIELRFLPRAGARLLWPTPPTPAVAPHIAKRGPPCTSRRSPTVAAPYQLTAAAPHPSTPAAPRRPASSCRPRTSPAAAWPKPSCTSWPSTTR